MLLNRPITTLGHLSLSPLYQMLSTKVSRSALTFVSTIVFFFNSINETSESVFASRLSLHFDGLQWGSPSVLCVEFAYLHACFCELDL